MQKKKLLKEVSLINKKWFLIFLLCLIYNIFNWCKLNNDTSCMSGSLVHIFLEKKYPFLYVQV